MKGAKKDGFAFPVDYHFLEAEGTLHTPHGGAKPPMRRVTGK